jgi:hypothetical protein
MFRTTVEDIEMWYDWAAICRVTFCGEPKTPKTSNTPKREEDL